MSTLSDLLQRGVQALGGSLSPDTASAGPISDRKQFVDYQTNCAEAGEQALGYAAWVKAGRPAGPNAAQSDNQQ